MNHIFFLIIGNFITACYSNNFTAFNLLRKQLEFPLQRRDNFLITKIPKGINWNDCFIFIGDSFVSKVKDVAVVKGTKEADQKNDIFFFDVTLLEETLYLEKRAEIKEGNLIYSPWFRFIKEPFDFSDREVNGKYITSALLYIVRLHKIEANTDFSENGINSIIFKKNFRGAYKIEVVFTNSLESIALVGEKGASVLDLKNQKFTLFSEHDEVLFNALTQSKDGVFKNLTMKKNEQQVEILKADG